MSVVWRAILIKMSNKVLILILMWSGILVAWTLASPPSGTPGATPAALFSDSAGNIGIKTTTPATLLDVNGTTTIRSSLDMTNNRIINVASPITDLDAVNKAYVDAQISSTTVKLWGQGRPNTSVVTVAGVCGGTSECYKDVDAGGSCNTGDIKIARSVRTATWDGAQAVCPANWWVCSAANRGTAACGSGNKNIIFCDVTTGTNDLSPNTADWGWIADTGTSATLERGMISRVIAGAANEQNACHLLPVWCCTYQ